MEFLDPDKKRAHQRRLFFGYVLVAITIAFSTVILVYLSYGYTIDRKTGQVIQNGTTFIDAKPEAADIYINGVRKDKTDARFSLPAGQYSVELKRDGYRSWAHPLNLEGGRIERLVYPKLFPVELKTSDVHLYSPLPSVTSQSPDLRWLLVLQPGSLGSFQLFDLNDSAKPPVAFGLPAGLLTNSPGEHTIKVVEWASNNRHVLLQHNFQGGQEYLLVDREKPAESINVDKTLGVNGAQISLRNKKQDQFYLYNSGQKTVSQTDLRTKAVAKVIEGVVAFESHEDDNILYVSDAGATAGKVKIKLRNKDGDYVIREQAASASYPISLARYSGRWYMVVGSQAEGRSYIYKDPAAVLSQKADTVLVPISVLKVPEVDEVAFSANSQLVMAEHGGLFSVYDIENDRRYQYDIKLPVEGTGKAAWMDGHRLMMLSGGKVVVFDYDGTNLQTLNAASLLPFFDRDYVNMYALAPSVTVPGQSAIVRTDLKVSK